MYYANFLNRFDNRCLNIFNLNNFKSSFKKNLLLLLNSSARISCSDIKNDFVYVKQSVLVYGIESFTGKGNGHSDTERIECMLKKSITSFEPRIIEKTLDISVENDKCNLLKVKIIGDFLYCNVINKINLKLVLDLETGKVC